MARNPEVVTVDPDLSSRAETKRAIQLAHFQVVGESGYGVEAVTVAMERPPDVFLVSFEEPVALALQTIEQLADAVPHAPTICYSSLTDAQSVRRAMVAGARDYIVKPLKPDQHQVILFDSQVPDPPALVAIERVAITVILVQHPAGLAGCIQVHDQGNGIKRLLAAVAEHGSKRQDRPGSHGSPLAQTASWRQM